MTLSSPRRAALLCVTLSAVFVACEFGAIREIRRNTFVEQHAVATSLDGQKMIYASDYVPAIYAFDLDTGEQTAGRALPEAAAVVALAQDPAGDGVLGLHANGAIVAWTASLNYAIVGRLPGNAPPDVSFVDIDASEEGDIFVLATRPHADGRSQYLLRLRAGAWTVAPIGVSDRSAERIAFDDQNDRLLVLVDRNNRFFDAYDPDLDLLYQARPGGAGAATDLDVIEGVVLIGGNDTVSIIQDLEEGGFVVDDTTAPLGQTIRSLAFAAYPDLATFEAVVQGQATASGQHLIQGIAVE